MRRALVLIIIAVLAAACGKKQPPASPAQPTDEKAKDADPATDGAAKDGEGAGATPSAAPPSDPCEGGE
jgi:hypothetical protein